MEQFHLGPLQAGYSEGGMMGIGEGGAIGVGEVEGSER